MFDVDWPEDTSWRWPWPSNDNPAWMAIGNSRIYLPHVRRIELQGTQVCVYYRDVSLPDVIHVGEAEAKRLRALGKKPVVAKDGE